MSVTPKSAPISRIEKVGQQPELWAVCRPSGTPVNVSATFHSCAAADTAFLDNHKGAINLNNMTVTATSDDDLPKDSVDQLVSIQ